MSRVPLSIALLLMCASLFPSVVGDDGKTHPVTLAIDPENPSFLFSVPLNIGLGNNCKLDINTIWGTGSENFQMYATNNAEDPCRSKEDPSYSGSPHRGSLVQTGGAVHTVYLLPVTQELKLDSSKKITGKLIIEADRVSAFAPLLTLQAVTTDADGKVVSTNIGSWKPAGLDEVQTDATADQYTNRHDFSFEMDAPSNITGKLRLTIDLRRNADGVRAVQAQAYRIGSWDAVQSYIDLPILSVVAEEEEEEEPEPVTCEDGKVVADESECEVAETEDPDENDPEQPEGPIGDPAGDNNTTSEQDNNTTKQQSDKGIPGFGLVPVMVAGLLVAAVWRRRLH